MNKCSSILLCFQMLLILAIKLRYSKESRYTVIKYSSTACSFHYFLVMKITSTFISVSLHPEKPLPVTEVCYNVSELYYNYLVKQDVLKSLQIVLQEFQIPMSNNLRLLLITHFLHIDRIT